MKTPARLLRVWAIHWTSISVITVGLVCLAVVAAMAQSGPIDNGHAEHHDVYKNWHQPGIFPPISCCHVRQVFNGGATIAGDCYGTVFRLGPKGYLARLSKEDQLRIGQEWIEVPDNKRIREINPDDTGADGHLCLSPGTNQVLCWVPPSPGG